MAEPLALSIDLGGTQLRAGLVDRSGGLHARASTKTDRVNGPQGVLDQIQTLAGRLLATVDRAEICGVAVSSPGPLDSETGVILDIPTLPGWTDVPLGDLLASQFGLDVTVENDGLAATLGEWRFGAGRGFKDLVYLTISTGIGGGAIVSGQPLRGWRRFSGNFGHIVIDYDSDIECVCGNLGCFEALGSGSALTSRARELALAPEGHGIRRASGGAEVDASHVTIAARVGDPGALRLMAKEGEIVGVGITTLSHVLSPEIVILGGGVSKGFDLLRQDIECAIRQRALAPFKHVPVCRSALADDAGLIGAASLVFDAN